MRDIGDLVCKTEVTNDNGVIDASYVGSLAWVYKLKDIVADNYILETVFIDDDLNIISFLEDNIKIEPPFSSGQWVNITESVKKHGVKYTRAMIREMDHRAFVEAVVKPTPLFRK